MITRLDNFNNYATADLLKWWTTLNTNASIFSGGRFGGNLLNLSGGTQGVRLLGVAASNRRAFGLNYIRISAIDSHRAELDFMVGAAVQVRITAKGNTIEAFRGTSTSIGSQAVTLVSDVWYYLEAEVTISSTVGTVKVWVNNVLVLNLAGVNTHSTGAASTDGYQIGNPNSGTHRFDELYLTDGEGTDNVGRLGPRRVIQPTLNGDGASSAWTPSAAVAHYTLVDDVSAPSEADYIESDTPGNIDLFTIAPLSGVTVSAINGVQLAIVARETGLTERECRSVTRVGGTNYNSAPSPLLSANFYKFNVWDQNPATAAPWSKTEVEGAQFGVELTT
jgi:hypothetical protein